MHFIEKGINYIKSSSEIKKNNSDISYYTISHHFTFCHVREIQLEESIKIVSIVLSNLPHHFCWSILPMVQETWVQSQVESYQRLKKWYMMPPCLTLSIIRYRSRVKWVNPEKGVGPSLTLRCKVWGVLSKKELSK